MLGRLPRQAAWRHVGARDGFEVTFAAEVNGGVCFTGRSDAGERALEVITDGAGRWRVDGRPAPHLDGCLDIDLESSVLTNAFPAHRLGLALGQRADAPAAHVRAQDLRVERLEQCHVCLENDDPGPRFEYAAPVFDFACELAYDHAGLLLDYPGLAVRAA